MSSASSGLKAAQIAAIAPILAALLLGSLPVLLGLSLYRRFARPGPLNA